MTKRNHIALRLLISFLVISGVVGLFYDTALTEPGEGEIQNGPQPALKKVEQGKNPSETNLRGMGVGNLLEIPGTAWEDPKESAAQEVERFHGKFALLGTVVGGKKYASAIIEDKELQTQKVYKIGYSISGGVITDILREKIVILIDGKCVMFRIEGGAGSRKEHVGPKLDEGSKWITASLGDMQVAFDSLNQPMSKATMVPRSPDLEIGSGGFQLQNVEPGSVFQKMGFKSGDVIEEINGNPVGDPFNAVAMYNLMKSVLPEDIFAEAGLDLQSFLNGTDNRMWIILQKLQKLFHLFQNRKDVRLTFAVRREGKQ
jgi:type II secretory pathway component PulC